MRKVILISLFAGLLTLSSCDALQQVSDTATFVLCDFSVANVKVDKIGGVSLANIKKPDDVGMLNMMSLAQQVMAGSLPTTLSVGIKATNNQSRVAGISGLGWELFMKDQKYGAGMINDAVTITPNSSTVFPVNVEFDILNIVTSSNIQQILDNVFDVDNKDKLNELELRLQLKPYYKVGTQVQEYPGIITIQP
ncbi:MAG: hypothetical protein KQH67_03950 [Bacteroidetes bacterium]|nr:hypothetical protein [Bacteroidota bacterium]